MANASLQTTLAPLLLFLNAKDTQEIMINRPDEIWVDDGQVISKHSIEMPFKMLKRLAELIAVQSGQVFNDEKPMLSATIPGGHRVQIMMSPACQMRMADGSWQDSICLSIRKQTWLEGDLRTFDKLGGFAEISNEQRDDSAWLHELYNQKQYVELLISAVKSKKTILISGGTYSGKTTLLNMLIKEMDANDRIITIEDTPEIHLSQENQVRLFYSRGMQHVASITATDLLTATLRMRPDRIIMGELRDKDGACWLQAANTGHQGTVSTIHSDTPLLAIQKLCDMVRMQYPMQSAESIKQYILSVVDVIIQMKREGQSGRRYISEMLIV
jgi:type IV secretion system protein VirB11